MRKSVFLRVIFGGVLATAVFLALARFKPSELLGQLQNLGPGAPLVFIAAYALATVCFLPGSLLTLGAGAIFGVGTGSVVVSAGATAGAASAFLIGRYLARDWVSRKIAGNAKFRAIDDAVAADGFKMTLLIRLSPVFPFNLINYAFGLTKVRFKDYVLASWIGMMPGTVLYVYLGSLAGDLASFGAGQRSKTPVEWLLYAVGLLATVAVTVVVTRTAKKALKAKVGS